MKQVTAYINKAGLITVGIKYRNPGASKYTRQIHAYRTKAEAQKAVDRHIANGYTYVTSVVFNTESRPN